MRRRLGGFFGWFDGFRRENDVGREDGKPEAGIRPLDHRLPTNDYRPTTTDQRLPAKFQIPRTKLQEPNSKYNSTDNRLSTIDNPQLANRQPTSAKKQSISNLQGFSCCLFKNGVLSSFVPRNQNFFIMKKRENIEGTCGCGNALLRDDQVMKYLGISSSTLLRMRKNREIPYSKLGGLYFYLLDEILQAIRDKMIFPVIPKPPLKTAGQAVLKKKNGKD